MEANMDQRAEIRAKTRVTAKVGRKSNEENDLGQRAQRRVGRPH
jgi:hypothetical protein